MSYKDRLCCEVGRNGVNVKVYSKVINKLSLPCENDVRTDDLVFEGKALYDPKPKNTNYGYTGEKTDHEQVSRYTGFYFCTDDIGDLLSEKGQFIEFDGEKFDIQFLQKPTMGSSHEVIGVLAFCIKIDEN